MEEPHGGSCWSEECVQVVNEHSYSLISPPLPHPFFNFKIEVHLIYYILHRVCMYTQTRKEQVFCAAGRSVGCTVCFRIRLLSFVADFVLSSLRYKC